MGWGRAGAAAAVRDAKDIDHRVDERRDAVGTAGGGAPRTSSSSLSASMVSET